jgi:inorganic pyrophosphatase
MSPEARRADANPLDICVVRESPLDCSEVMVNAGVIGALQALDGGEATTSGSVVGG